MSHTPGPLDDIPNKGFNYTQVISPRGQLLASCYGPDRIDNARLFAAAPEMLAALKVARNLATQFCYVCDGILHEDPTSKALQHSPTCQEITEAIAKAEKENNNEQ